jgi:hypothetical protein
MPSREQMTQADYDFSDVPESELLACYIYEYSRESRAVREEVTQIRKQIEAHGSKGGQIHTEVPSPFFSSIL